MLTPQEKWVGAGALVVLAFSVGAVTGCDCLACEPTGYVHWAPESPAEPLGVPPYLWRLDEAMAGVRCDWKE